MFFLNNKITGTCIKKKKKNYRHNIFIIEPMHQTIKRNTTEMLRPYYFYNIFTTNHKWLIVIGSNLNLTLRLLCYLNNNNQ